MNKQRTRILRIAKEFCEKRFQGAESPLSGPAPMAVLDP
jgi:hypothetical protein